MRKLTTAILGAVLIATCSGFLSLGGSAATSSGNPFNLPRVLATDNILTFLGSFKAPTSFVYRGGAMSVNGSTMYLSGLYYYNSGSSYVNGIGSFTIPTLTGAPALDGSNGTATALVAPTTLVDGSGNPILDCGQGASYGNNTYCVFTGSLVYGGKLYMTVGPYYDQSTSALPGFLVSTDTGISTWGLVNAASGAGCLSSSPGCTQRYFAGPLGVLPSIWQPYFGGPCYESAGPGGLSNNTRSPNGFSLATFNCAAYNAAGGSISVHEALDYYYQTVSRNPSQYQLAYRSFSGPFPTGGSGVSYTLTSQPTTATTSVTLTAAFSSNTAATIGPFQITFNITGGGTATRIVHLTNGMTAVPDGTTTCYYGVTGCVSFPALTECNPSCTTAVTIAPMGDNYYSEYEGGDLGYGFFVPGSRSFLVINIHQYGPSGAAGSGCDKGASGSNDTPLSPDTRHYRRLQISAYDANDLYAGYNGSQAVYVAAPYAEWDFPNWQANWGGTTNCINGGPPGNFYFDPNTSILYGTFSSNQDGSGHMIVNEWQVSGT